MKTIALILALALASCTAFTAPKDQVTGIRQDAPPEWAGTPDPRETPAVDIVEPTANGYWGPFGAAPLKHRNFSGSP